MSDDFKLLWNNLPFPAFVIDADHTVIQGNATAEQLAQTSQNQMIGKKLSRYFGATGVVLDTLKQAKLEKSSISQYGVNLTTVTRETLLCDLHVNFLGATLDQMLLVIQPTGVAHKMSQSITHSSAARSVTAMASMLAHEIRNPLAGISGAAQLLAMNSSDDDTELAEMIDQEAKRIGTLVDRFEHFSDDRPAMRNAFNIHDILDRAIRSAQAGFGADVRILKEYDPSLPDASGDGDQLLQVFQNLLKNASEAVEHGHGIIRVRTSYKSGVKFAVSGTKRETLPLQIEFIDNGKGIPNNIIDDVFEPFVSSKSNGTGLGLSLVSKIVTNHGGLVEHQALEQGTAFILRLPIWKKHSKENT
jgi:two-component system nitrogen regulation sensor histidine kinase GlnL